MYAVLRDGNRQYKVTEGETLWIDLRADSKKGDTLELTDVVLYSNGSDLRIGQPTVAGAKIVAEVMGEVKGEKLRVVKRRRRESFEKETGHRQHHTAVKIRQIAVG
ncbi:MAG: 50S ribosomal protein L21 [Planctomycetes bacterium]|nr:50S ribosomal protein L21 [Planctomycetota bacterium]